MVIMDIGIVGSGIAGLYLALYLQRNGHRVTIFEAEDRIGGRIFTHWFDENVYFEAGAMRIPRSKLHSRVYHFIRYLNVNGRQDDKIELIPYIQEHSNNMAFIHNARCNLDNPQLSARLNLPLPPRYQGKPARELLGEVISPWLALLQKDFDFGFSQISQYDVISFRAYLHLVAGWPHEVIDFVELMTSQTNQFDLSFIEIIMQNLDFNTQNWATVQGGMSRLVQSAVRLVGLENIHTNARVHQIVERQDGKVTLRTTGPPGGTFDKVILAIPPAALHRIHDRPTWSFMKEQAIRSMHFEPLYKLGIHFRTRFWEKTPSPCFGGQSATDLRFRWIVYPSNDLGSPSAGVLLLYCWMNDAYRMQSIPRDQRISLALHDLQRFYDTVDVFDQYVDAFDVCWSQEYATGDAMFLPGQFTRFHQVAKQPEGNIHFAGEHLSRHHTWIAGAIDSALHVVMQIQGEKDVRGLGEEYIKATPKRLDEPWRAYVIPHHNNLEYVAEC